MPTVRVIGERGEKLGVMSTGAALILAQQAELDLVEVSPKAEPPVVKIVDFGKLQYEKEKQLRKSKALSKKAGGGEIKGLRLSMKISDHDIMVRVKAGQKFLDHGHKVKIEVRMHGREKAHPELARVVIERFIKLLEREITLEQPIKRLGSAFSALISVKKQ